MLMTPKSEIPNLAEMVSFFRLIDSHVTFFGYARNDKKQAKREQ